MIRRFSCGSVTPASAVEEPLSGVDDVQVGLEVVAERRAMTDFGFALAQQAVVDEDARQPAGRSPRYSSAATTDESTPPDRPQMTRLLADPLANVGDRLLDERRIFHVPVQPQTS